MIPHQVTIQAHAPGTWSTSAAGVVGTLDHDDELVIDGSPVRGEHHFGVIAERDRINAVWGDAVIEVAKRGGHDIVRPRHPGTALLTAFTGIPAYTPDPRWVTTGRYIAFDEPRPTTVGRAGLSTARSTCPAPTPSWRPARAPCREPSADRDRSGREDTARTALKVALGHVHTGHLL